MDRPGVERKLTAILAADVVGYSRLMYADDQATLQALTESRELFFREGRRAWRAYRERPRRLDPVPTIGEHTDRILAEIGYGAANIAELYKAAVV